MIFDFAIGGAAARWTGDALTAFAPQSKPEIILFLSPNPS